MLGFTGHRCQTGAFVKSFQQLDLDTYSFASLFHFNVFLLIKDRFYSRRSSGRSCSEKRRAILSGENQTDGVACF